MCCCVTGISGASYYEGSFSNINRSLEGNYVAVSSRGNFYMTWTPGQTYWQPHNRPGARRVQNMGWTPANELWLTTRGGDVLLNQEPGVSDKFETARLTSRGFGVLDVGYVQSAAQLCRSRAASVKDHCLVLHPLKIIVYSPGTVHSLHIAFLTGLTRAVPALLITMR